MKLRFFSVLALALWLVCLVSAQDQTAPTPTVQNPPSAGQAGAGSGARGGRRAGGGGFGGGMGMARGLEGTVTEVAADHYMIKTDAGDLYTVRFSANTRVMKQAPGAGLRGQSQGSENAPGQGRGQGMGGMRGNPPQEIKSGEVKTGDVIAVMSDPNEPVTNKTVGAVAVIVMDPQMVQQMREMQANFGKTWLAGKVTAINDTKITLTGAADNAAHTVVADENTTFRKRRDPVTLADIQVGDTIRADGAIKDGAFVATTVNVMGGMNGGEPSLPRNAPPQ